VALSIELAADALYLALARAPRIEAWGRRACAPPDRGKPGLSDGASHPLENSSAKA